MNERPELPRIEPTGPFEEHTRRVAATAAVEAVEHELFNETRGEVDVSILVNGRYLHTKTDRDTVHRVIDILFGLE